MVLSLFVNIPNYYLFLLSGLLPWQFFARSLSNATSSLVTERNILQKAKFPYETIPLSIVFANFLDLIIAFLLLVIFLAITGLIKLPTIFLIIPASLFLLIFTCGAVLLLSSLQVIYRDVSLLVRTLLNLWFYSSPILYSLDLVPPKYRLLFAFNPLTTVFELFHTAVINNRSLNSSILTINTGLLLLITLIGINTYRKQKNHFVDWI